MLRHYLKITFAIFWGALFVFAIFSWFHSGIGLKEVPQLLYDWMQHFGLLKSATLYIVLYAIRPLILFPASILTIASGLIFGPWLGIVFTMIGENASANVGFGIARWLGRDWVGAHEHGTILRWEKKIRENGLVAVLIMRLLYLPFDVVNYGCGLTSMRYMDYFIGTLIGIIPGVFSFVLIGGVASANTGNRILVFGLAVFFFFLGLIIARVIHKKRPEAVNQQ